MSINRETSTDIYPNGINKTGSPKYNDLYINF